jgi:DNA-binding MarR family transcriptional regulator
MRQSGHYLFHRARGNEAHGQERILRILSETGGMSQKELQCRLGIQPGSVSEILSKMEEKELIARARSSQDGRRMDLVLTDKGRERAAELRKDDAEELFQALTPKEQEQLKVLMTKLVTSWLKDPKESG